MMAAASGTIHADAGALRIADDLESRGLAIVYNPAPSPPHIRKIMGKGDKRTRRGKIFKGSYGKSRAHSVKPKKGAARKPSR